MSFKTVGVVGAGAWGTALAQIAARAGLEVTLWAREAEVVAAVEGARENPLFLPGVRIEDGVRATAELEAVAACDLVLAVPPAQHMRATLAALAPALRPGAPLVLCSKGVEQGSRWRRRPARTRGWRCSRAPASRARWRGRSRPR